MTEPRLCSRCVLPESPPAITLNEKGVCSVCVADDRHRGTRATPKPLETDLLKILDKHRGKKTYECLVMCSGGKDSTSALYYMKKRYKLNPLAFTFDHGFETEGAMTNVRNAVEALGVDFIFFRSDFMQDLFARILNSGSEAVICHPCSLWYMELAFDFAARFDIPIIVAGWTKGQSQQQPAVSKYGCNNHAPEFTRMSRATREFLENELQDMPKYAHFPRTMEDVVKRARKRHKSLVISPHWFLPFGVDDYVATIEKELGWTFPELSYPARSTNCLLNYVSVHQSLKHYGYTHYHVEMSKMIREGLVTREDALEQLKADFDKDFLNSIVEKLGCRIS